MLAATIGLSTVLGLYRPDLSSLRHAVSGLDLDEPAAQLLVLVAPLVLLPVFWGEEFGWRS